MNELNEFNNVVKFNHDNKNASVKCKTSQILTYPQSVNQWWFGWLRLIGFDYLKKTKNLIAKQFILKINHVTSNLW